MRDLGADHDLEVTPVSLQTPRMAASSRVFVRVLCHHLLGSSFACYVFQKLRPSFGEHVKEWNRLFDNAHLTSQDRKPSVGFQHELFDRELIETLKLCINVVQIDAISVVIVGCGPVIRVRVKLVPGFHLHQQGPPAAFLLVVAICFVDLAVCQFDEERAALLNDLVL